jgi:hypothetical protein
VITLRIRQAKEALLENRVAFVPKHQCQAKVLRAIADAGNAIFAPAIGPAAGVIMREIFPGGAARAVILADGSPLAVGDVRPPAPPKFLARFP